MFFFWWKDQKNSIPKVTQVDFSQIETGLSEASNVEEVWQFLHAEFERVKEKRLRPRIARIDTYIHTYIHIYTYIHIKIHTRHTHIYTLNIRTWYMYIIYAYVCNISHLYVEYYICLPYCMPVCLSVTLGQSHKRYVSHLKWFWQYMGVVLKPMQDF